MDPGTSTYRPDVDGLRAVAVLSVLLFHAGLEPFAGGYVGVDVFFVISGYVIALSLKRDLDAQRFSLWRFYERRARRILPALSVVMLATLAFATWLAPPRFFDAFLQSFNSAAIFLSNVNFWRESGYFNTDDHFRPLLHTWSLGVEEQFYIAAPLLIYGIYRRFRSRWLLALTPLIAISFAWGLRDLLRLRIDAAFYLPQGRAWELLLGAALALSPLRGPKSRLVSEALSLIGFGLICLAVFIYTPETPFPGPAALVPCFGAGLIIFAGDQDAGRPSISRLLSWKPIVAIGLVSYSLYLVHLPILVLLKFALMRELAPGEVVAAICACMVTATLMYWLVERPFRLAPAPRQLVLSLAALSIVGLLAAGALASLLNQKLYADVGSSIEEPAWQELDPALRTGKCLLVTGQSFEGWSPDACARTAGPGDDILLFGDSFAAHYAPGLEGLQSRVRGRVLQYSMQGCPPILGFENPAYPGCGKFIRHALDIVKTRQIKRVVIAGSWLEYGPAISLTIGPTLKTFRATDADVTLIGQSPNFYLQPFAMAQRLGKADDLNVTLDIGLQAAKINEELATLAAENGVRFINPIAALCSGSLCPTRVNGEELYVDYGHFTPAGSTRAASAYFPYLTK
jgi:peptidoglycan/LPS O-acetylase OafA/YrhL